MDLPALLPRHGHRRDQHRLLHRTSYSVLPTIGAKLAIDKELPPPRAQVGSTHLHSEQSAASSIARAFSRRCGRMAVANYPILFCFAGRNSVIARLTGEFATARMPSCSAIRLTRAHTGFEYQVHTLVDPTREKLY